MKTRSKTIVLIATLVLAIASFGALAATTQVTDAQKETCFKAHGKLMSKPALMNVNDCWRAHGYKFYQ